MTGINQNGDREKIIIRTSLTGIGTNVLLAAFKAAAGLAAGSIAIVLDAVNNLSDALSSLITIIGARLAAKAPDREHPYGYGRIEYLSASVIAAIVLYAGLTSFTESVKKILYPETPEYSFLTLGILAASIAVKLLLGSYVKKTGEEVNSNSLVASGKDAANDAVLSASVLVSALVYLFADISLEGIVGVLISAVIIKSGIEMLKTTVDDVLGARIDGELSRKIKKTAADDPLVYGAYDLVLNSYGPGRLQGSVHVEVSDQLSAADIDSMTRRIQNAVYHEHGVILTAVGIYAMHTGDDEISAMLTEITRKVMSHEGVIQMHGFHVDRELKKIVFDIIIGFDSDRKGIWEQICAEVSEMYPGWDVSITLDADISD